MKSNIILFIIFIWLFFACSREDTNNPVINLNPDTDLNHYRTEPYFDPGINVADDYSCDLTENIQILNEVDVNHYGSYYVTYIAEDEAGNLAEEKRQVDIILPIIDYYSQDYLAFDTCTSSNFFYTGLIQDCDCDDFSVIVGNISNFGLSASFTLPISGQYNQILLLDTVKAAVHFIGSGTMSTGADTLFWDYTIQDSITTDICRSVWIKEN